MSITQRFFLTNAAAGYTPTTLRGAWDATASAVTKNLGRQPSGTTTTVGIAETSTTNNWDVLLYRGVSDPLDKAYTFTTSDKVQICAGLKESNASANDFIHVHIYVTTGDSDTPRGTILTDSIGATEFTTTAGFRTDGLKTLAGLACSSGDRVVVEIGYQGQNTSATSFTGTLNYGGVDTSGVAAATDVTVSVGWVEFTTSAHFFNTSSITFNPSLKGSNVTLSDGNLHGGETFAGSEIQGSSLVTGAGKSTGRVVVRYIIKANDQFGPNPGFAVASQDMSNQIGVEATNTWGAAAADNFGFWCDTTGQGVHVGNQLINNVFSHPNPGDSFYIAWDIDARSAYTRVNQGVWYGFGGALPGGTTPDNDTTVAGGFTNAYNWSSSVPSALTWLPGCGFDTSTGSNLVEIDCLAYGHGLTTFQPYDGGGITGSGSGTAPAPQAAGTGSLSESGSGGGAAPAPQGSGTGSLAESGSGSGAAPAPQGSGTGGLSESGSGSGAAPAPQAAGTGGLAESGSGSGVAPAPQASGTGGLSESGSGSGAAPAPAAAGTGGLAESGSGSGAAPAPQGAGTGGLAESGSGSGTAPAPQGSGTGALAQSGSGSGTAPAPAAAGTGGLVDPGSGSGTAPDPQGGGTGTLGTAAGDLFSMAFAITGPSLTMAPSAGTLGMDFAVAADMAVAIMSGRAAVALQSGSLTMQITSAD